MKKYDDYNALTSLDESREISKLILEFNKTINDLYDLHNNKLISENDKSLLEVSLWSKAKFLLSKLGRYKAGGKILGKGKIDQEAGAKIQSIIDKKGNELIKGLHELIQQLNKKGKGEFPNNQDPDIFLDVILNIASVYDSMVASTKLKPDEEGYLPIDVVNSIISDLREYVKKYLDVDLKAVYSVMDSEEDKVDSDKEVLITDNDEHIDEDKSSDVRKELQTKKGEDAEEINSERMKTLKSWRLPLALMGAGASFGALSWLIEYIFPAEKITTYTPEEIKKITEETIGHVKPGDGMTQTFNSIKGLGVNLTPNSSPEEVVGVLNKLGGGDAHKGVEILTQKGGMFVKPELANDTLHQLVNNPTEHGDTLKEVFASNSTRAGTGKIIGDTLATHDGGTITQMVVKSFIKWTTKTVIKKSAVALVAGPILKVLGIGLLGAGVLVKLFREKGKRQSRAKTLNDLLQSLQFVKGQPVLDTTPIAGEEEVSSGEDKIPSDEKEASSDEKEVSSGKGQSISGEVPKKTNTDKISVPSEFLQGNRNMQLAYLASNFLPEGQSFWSNLKLKEGITIPSGFLDASLGQGKSDPEKYLKAYYNFLKKNDSFTQDLNIGSWLAVIKSDKNQSLIRWIRNTRKGVGNFMKTIQKTFPEFQIGERQKAKVVKPGKKGEGMGVAGESLNGRFDLILEVNLGKIASEAGFDENQFMKNLPQFMEMISMMYYGLKGQKLPYNKEAVIDKCKKYGCKTNSGKRFKKAKSADYKFVESNQPLKEEIKRIKALMK